MPLESSRKLGFTASLISIIVPPVIIALYGILIFSFITSISSNIINRGGTSPFASPFLAFGIISIAFIALGLLSLIGLILFFISMHQLSHYYNEPGIFKNIVYYLVTIIVGVAVVFGITLAIIFSVAASVSSNPSAVGVFGIGLIGIILGAIALGLISALFFKRAFNKLAEKSGVQSFDTAGLLILLGAIIPIVSWIGWIFAALGFNSLKSKPTETTPLYSTPGYVTPSAPLPPTTAQKVICPNCRAENTLDSEYCWSCGKKLS